MAKNLITTPKGRAVFPHVHAPDTKFDSDGVYSTKLDIPAGPEADAFMAKLDELTEQSVAQAKKENPKVAGKILRAEPYEVQDDGTVRINVKMKAQGTRKDGTVYTQKPAIFDAQGRPVQGLNVGGGSVIRVSIDPFLYYMASTKQAGVSLRLKAVQVITLVEFGGGSADYFGFNAEEDGFDSTAAASSNGFSSEAEDEESTDEDEDF